MRHSAWVLTVTIAAVVWPLALTAAQPIASIIPVTVNAGFYELSQLYQNVQNTVPVPVPAKSVLHGWQPWLGWSSGAIAEGGLRLHLVRADGTRILLLRTSPHKETAGIYDAAATPQNLPVGTGLRLGPGESLEVQLRCRNMSWSIIQCEGRATLFFTADLTE